MQLQTRTILAIRALQKLEGAPTRLGLEELAQGLNIGVKLCGNVMVRCAVLVSWMSSGVRAVATEPCSRPAIFRWLISWPSLSG